VIAFSPKPERFLLRDLHNVEPGIARCFVGEVEQYVDFFKGSVCGFGVEEVNERDNKKVGACENNECVVCYVVKGDRGDEDDAGMLSAIERLYHVPSEQSRRSRLTQN
jgi:hypothetical protein